MDASDFLDDLSVRIYEPPLAGFRDDERIRDTSNPLSVVMLLIDYETECSMNGILGFLGNSSGQRLPETIDALRMIGCSTHASTLNEIKDVATSGGMTNAAIQDDRERLSAFSVTSFAELHGNKWDAVCDKIDELYDTIDLDDSWPCLTEFVRRNLDEIRGQL